MSSSGRKPNSRGGRGGRGSRGGRRNKGNKPRDKVPADDTALREEDVLIAFAPYVRSENAKALEIQNAFQSSNDQKAFVRAARQFLEDPQKDAPKETTPSEVVPVDIPAVSELEEHMTGLTVKEDPVVPQTPPRSSVSAPPGMASPISPPPGSWQPTPPGIKMSPASMSPGLNMPHTPPRTLLSPRVIPETPFLSPVGEQIPETPIIPESPFEEATPAKAKPVYQPKRLWTRIEEQPGRVLANNVPFGNTVNLRPRQELTAQWVLPVKYIQQHAAKFFPSEKDLSLRDGLQRLTVGLFRRGCTENTSSIISKEVTSEERRDYPFQLKGDVVVGSIPFFSPRTPGNVVLRLFFDNDPLYTLALGPTLHVQVAPDDVESTLRFILSNFKAKKGAATSLSSLNSFHIVLETFHVPPKTSRHGWEGAGRAAWGCLCESRKVYETCAREYLKQKEKLAKAETEVNELKEQVEAEGDDANEELTEKLREKTGSLMGGRASNERKWRDAQVAYASILQTLVSNPSCQLLASRELITKARFGLELFCPLCEWFAPSPFNSDSDSLCINIDDFPRQVNPAQFQKCTDSRAKMQLDSLGFVPSFMSLEQVLAPKEKPRQGQNNRGMDPTAVDALNRLSASMGEIYQREYMVSDQIHKQRELVRSHVESYLSQCDAFPAGTSVVVFGSSANGFGSPSSDLDMCLQLPPKTKLVDENDDTGAHAMAKLAELFKAGGLTDVNTERLTARIPIVMFSCPRPMASANQNSLVECDLSMQNPLACLNTSLLLTYSQIHPVTRVLASIIKRWAKSRDINSPSDRTLSTYGYILMLLHFLTYHKRTGSGLVTTIENPDNRQPWTPLLPNLQWMDPRWPESPPQTPYLELPAKPKQLLVHPSDPNGFVVNTYFYRLKDAAALSRLQQRFPGQDLSLSILLASFFRYYAYEFDYKRHVVSLNATATRGMVDREKKAEMDCWRAYGTGLSIEDPFETFYDVAHVVKGPNFHRIRNEFSMAYTKIVSVATGTSWKDKDVSNMSGNDLIDWICEPVDKKQDD